MAKYQVNMSIRVGKIIEIEANNLNEAETIARNMLVTDDINDYEYVDSSVDVYEL